jgi:DNA polymerase-3 subunit alpha
MAQFADYGFNRSHSVAYAYLAYQTAYLKAHYPAYFYAAVLSNESNDTTKIYKYSSELRSTGLGFLPPDINESDADFTPLENAVRFGLSAIKGLGASGIQTIIEARRGEKFTSLFDFTSRLDQGFLNRRGLESLISAGAFDTLMPSETTVFHWRANLFSDLDAALSHGQKVWQNKIRGQNNLFGATETSRNEMKGQFKNVPAWSSAELSKQEKLAIGC